MAEAREHDVLIEAPPNPESVGVWADEGMEEIIEGIDGVHSVSGFGTRYFVDIDLRYSRETLMENIEAAIMLEMAIRQTEESDDGS